MNTIKVDGATHVKIGARVVARAIECDYAIDSFTKLSDIAYLWRRKTLSPVTQTKLHLTVPESDGITVALMAASEEDKNAYSYTQHRGKNCQNYVVKWPKDDGVSLSPYEFMERTFFSEAPTKNAFEAIIVAYETNNKENQYEKLLDFAREYYAQAK